MEGHGKSAERVQFVWAVKSSADASWAVKSEGRIPLNDDENVKIYITQASFSEMNEESVIPGSTNPVSPGAGSAIELQPLPKSGGEDVVTARGGYQRPDLRAIVDGVFRLWREERVAVIVCGTAGMARGVRREVGRWVEGGREVWFHDEGFGW